MNAVAQKIEDYLRVLAPHNRSRLAARVLQEALSEINRLEGELMLKIYSLEKIGRKWADEN